MEYTEAVNVIKANYSQPQATKMLNFHEGTVQLLAKLCKEGTKQNLTDSTIDRLLPMEPDRQAGWIANPFMEFLMDKLLASCNGSSTASVTTNNGPKQPETNTNKKPEPVQPKKVEPEPEPEAPLFDLFA